MAHEGELFIGGSWVAPRGGSSLEVVSPHTEERTAHLYADVDNSMRIAREEIFGPVLTVIPDATDEDAVRLADDSEYGLSGSVWTNDVERGLAVARRVRAGTFGVNQPYRMDPAAAFGGVKASGFGRELGSEGLESYLDVKAISVAPSA